METYNKHIKFIFDILLILMKISILSFVHDKIWETSLQYQPENSEIIEDMNNTICSICLELYIMRVIY